MKVWTVVLQTMPYQCSVQPACSQDQQSITIEAWWYLSATNIAAILRRMQPSDIAASDIAAAHICRNSSGRFFSARMTVSSIS